MNIRLTLFACFLSVVALAQAPLDCANMCVADISVIPGTDSMVVVLQNGSTTINYPVVVVIANGDTVANAEEEFFIFAQLPGQSVEHFLTTTLTELPENFTCSVMVTDNIWDQTCELSYPCLPMALEEHPSFLFRVWPNPTDGRLWMNNLQKIQHLEIYNTAGKVVLRKQHFTDDFLDLQDLIPGLYTIVAIEKNGQKLTTTFTRK